MASYGQWRGEELDNERPTPSERQYLADLRPGADEIHAPHKPAQLLDQELEAEEAA